MTLSHILVWHFFSNVCVSPDLDVCLVELEQRVQFFRLKMTTNSQAIDMSSKTEKEMKTANKKKSQLLQEAEEYKEKLEQRGVIYVSRVPPFMKPNKARDLFEQYGEVTRLYLAEEGEYTVDSCNMYA